LQAPSRPERVILLKFATLVELLGFRLPIANDQAICSIPSKHRDFIPRIRPDRLEHKRGQPSPDKTIEKSLLPVDTGGAGIDVGGGSDRRTDPASQNFLLKKGRLSPATGWLDGSKRW